MYIYGYWPVIDSETTLLFRKRGVLLERRFSAGQYTTSMAARQRNISKAKRRAANPFSGARLGETSAAGPTISKLDKSGLYDLQQVKRVLDDHVIAVRRLRMSHCLEAVYCFWHRRLFSECI